MSVLLGVRELPADVLLDVAVLLPPTVPSSVCQKGVATAAARAASSFGIMLDGLRENGFRGRADSKDCALQLGPCWLKSQTGL